MKSDKVRTEVEAWIKVYQGDVHYWEKEVRRHLQELNQLESERGKDGVCSESNVVILSWCVSHSLMMFSSLVTDGCMILYVMGPIGMGHSTTVVCT